MRRSGVAIALATLLLACGHASKPLVRPSGRPNILLITIDTWRADALGCQGAPGVHTPALDALAARGARFADASAQVPLTLPSHATILTGRLPAHDGVHVNGDDVLPGNVPTIATTLHDAGWDCAAFVSAFCLASQFGLARGFDPYDDDLGNGPFLLTAGAGRGERPASEVVRGASAFLATQRTAPFLLWVHLYEPHAPYAPPPAHAHGETPRERYDGEVATADDAVASLLAALQQSGHASDTIVAVMGDHGEAFGEHGEKGHGFFLWETTLRVPLLISWPGVIPASVVRSPVRLVDVAPTLWSLAGVAAPLGCDGRSLVPLIEGRSMPEASVPAESLYAARSFGWAPLHSIRDDGWKLIDAPKPKLFEISEDPGEVRDVAAKESSRIEKLRQLLVPDDTTASTSSDLDPADRERLTSLGYVTAGAARHPGAAPRDPHDGLDVVSALDEGLELVASRDWRGAADRFTTLAESEPDNPSVRFQLGRCLLELHDRDGARKNFESAVKADPRLASAWEQLGAIAEAEGRADDAIAILEEGRKACPASITLRLRHGIALLRAHRAAEASEILDAACREAPGAADAWMFAGEARLAAGDRAGAIDAYRRAVALVPRSTQAAQRLQQIEAGPVAAGPTR